MERTAAILGASPKDSRYAFKAQVMLTQHKIRVYPVNPAYEEILGERCYKDITQVPPVETLTVYVGDAHIGPMIPQILAAKPGRVILNPGTESKVLEEALEKAGIPYLHACTLVLLTTNQY